MNPHLDYHDGHSVAPAQAQRRPDISDPRGIVWIRGGYARLRQPAWARTTLIVFDGAGQRAGLTPTIPVGEGPTGIALDEARQRLYVITKHSTPRSRS
jgi:DNA-binding beta-propeller fold protein YncE